MRTRDKANETQESMEITLLFVRKKMNLYLDYLPISSNSGMFDITD